MSQIILYLRSNEIILASKLENLRILECKQFISRSIDFGKFLTLNIFYAPIFYQGCVTNLYVKKNCIQRKKWKRHFRHRRSICWVVFVGKKGATFIVDSYWASVEYLSCAKKVQISVNNCLVSRIFISCSKSNYSLLNEKNLLRRENYYWAKWTLS